MSLADDVQEYQEQDPDPCGTGVWFGGLPERDKNAFETFLAAGGATSVLWRMARKNGCPTAETSFRRHCRQRCSCYTEAEIAA